MIAAPIELVFGSWVLATVAATYVLAGVFHDVRRRRGRARHRRMQHDLATVLFRPVPEAAAAANRLARGSKAAMYDLIQRSATDLSGVADQRLRSLVATAGLGPGIRRRIRSRSWRSRAQGAALASLLPAGDAGRLALLDDRHALVRARAVEAMEQDDIADHPELVTAMLDDESRAVRLAAQNALLRGGAPVVPALEEHMRSSDGVGTVYALEVAANLPDPRLIPVIEHHARSSRPDCRALAAKALGPLAATSPVLAELLGDQSAEVRAEAALAIGYGGIEFRAADIGLLLRDRSWSVRRAAGQALATMGPTGIATLRVYADDVDAYARDLARQVLATIAARTEPAQVGR